MSTRETMYANNRQAREAVTGDLLPLTPEQREWVERHMPPSQSFPVFRSEFASNRPPAWQWPNVPSVRGPESA